MKVKAVKYISDYCISVTFEDAVVGVIKLDDLVTKGVFKVLQDKTAFAKVYTTGYSIAWSDDLEIDATSIYSDITGKNISEIYRSKISHATN